MCRERTILHRQGCQGIPYSVGLYFTFKQKRKVGARTFTTQPPQQCSWHLGHGEPRGGRGAYDLTRHPAHNEIYGCRLSGSGTSQAAAQGLLVRGSRVRAIHARNHAESQIESTLNPACSAQWSASCSAVSISCAAAASCSALMLPRRSSSCSAVHSAGGAALHPVRRWRSVHSGWSACELAASFSWAVSPTANDGGGGGGRWYASPAAGQGCS